MMIQKPYAEKIKFSRVTQGKPKFKTPLKGKSGSGVWGESVDFEDDVRQFIRESLLNEELNKSDKKEIERIAKKQASKIVAAEIDKALGSSFFGTKGKVNKFVSDEVSKRFKQGRRDPDFADTVETICKEILKKFHRDMALKYPQMVDRIKIR